MLEVIFIFLSLSAQANNSPFRIYLDATPDLLLHFQSLAVKQELPSLDTLLGQANVLVGRYASQEAYEQSLSAAESVDAPVPMKVKPGLASTLQNSDFANADPTTTTQINDDAEVDPPSLPAENIPKAHQEADNFDGDRVLANSILFLQDFGWWIEMLYAVPEGNIGRVFEILKVK